MIRRSVLEWSYLEVADTETETSVTRQVADSLVAAASQGLSKWRR